jgi:transcriptional regulator with XRE-family HTH domain
MTSKSSRRHSDLSDYGFARVRDMAFDAVHALWRRRQASGVEQKQLAEKIKCSPARLNRTLRGPGNWTLRTFGELVEALDGEAEIRVFGLEDPVEHLKNYDAYEARKSVDAQAKQKAPSPLIPPKEDTQMAAPPTGNTAIAQMA